MSAARCSQCHNYSRNCPPGQPNHRGVPIGQNCTMNGIGRHYRDPADPQNPICNYESLGSPCTFFEDNPDLAAIPYPEDMSFGPVSGEQSQPPPDPQQPLNMGAIIELLRQQKEDSDRQLKKMQEEQTNQMRVLQQQVNALTSSSTATPIVAASSTPGTASITTVANSYSSPSVTSSNVTIPSALPLTTPAPAQNLVANAAASLNAVLQAGLGQGSQGHSGLTMEHLRSNPSIVSQAAAVLANVTDNVPPLQQFGGIGTRGLQQNQVSSVDQLYKATTINKQLRCHEFASTGQFSFSNQLKLDNCNAVAFAFGAFKHLEACKSGLITNVSDTEFLARLRHLKNVYEIACLSSSINSFSDPAWLVSREYDNRVISDIESGVKTWESLSFGIEPDAIYCAKETVENRQKMNKKAPKGQENRTKDFDKKGRKACTTYNTHKASEGCFWEHTNKGEVCVFDHFCAWCKQNRNVVEKHKSINCEHKTE